MFTARQPTLREAARPIGERFYRPGLDILRALAFLLVFMAHGLVWQLDKHTAVGAIGRVGEFGVGIFFFLSSYLITELLLREKRVTGNIQIPAFYARRILRIWPLYFAMIALCWGYGLVSPSHTLSLAWLLSMSLLFTNWYAAGHGYPPGFVYPLWSLAIEEQFYLLWPFLVKYLSPADLLKVALFFIAAAYLMLAHLLGQGQSLDPAIWVNSLVQFQFFALGAGLAVVLRGRTPQLNRAWRFALFLAGLLCLRAAQAAVYVNNPALAHDFAHIAPRFVSALAGCVCLFFSCLGCPAGSLQKPFIYLGKISYGLYVFHVLWLGLVRDGMLHVLGKGVSPLAFQLIVMAVALPATILTAMLSYRYLESPFLRWKKSFTIVASRPAERTNPSVMQWRPRPRLKAS
jgi:peptidoglycan/LPS O-acetylase OafA/YrhL